MARLFQDSADHYDTASYLYKWSAALPQITVSVVGSIVGMTGNCLRVQGGVGNPQMMWRNLSANVSGTLFTGFRFQPTTLPSGGVTPIYATMAAGAAQIVLTINSAGQIEAWSGPGAGGWLTSFPTGAIKIASSVPGIISAGVTNYIELSTLASTTVGTCTVWVNNVQLFTVSSANTDRAGTGYNNQIALVSPDNLQIMYYDDQYVNDTTTPASDPNNNIRVGPQRLVIEFVAGPGQWAQWTKGGSGAPATNAAAVASSSPQPDNDTTYNAAASTTLKDAFAMTPATGIASITAVSWVACPRTDDGGSATITPLYGNGSTNAFGTAIAVPSSYSFLFQNTGINPLTSSAWAVADLSTLQCGYRRDG